MNIQPEIDKLDSQFPEVHFSQVNRDGRQQYGKPFVYVNDVLHYLQEYGSEIVGIVNSDIHLRASSDFISYIQEQAHNSVVFASRIDIDTPQSIEGEMYGYGFDLFFFD